MTAAYSYLDVYIAEPSAESLPRTATADYRSSMTRSIKGFPCRCRCRLDFRGMVIGSSVRILWGFFLMSRALGMQSAFGMGYPRTTHFACSAQLGLIVQALFRFASEGQPCPRKTIGAI